MRLVVLLLWLLLSSLAYSNGTQNFHFLGLSDIHFNPFSSCEESASACPAIDALRTAPISEWEKILAQYDTKTNTYYQDTNYALLKETLAEVKVRAAANHIRFAIILGDFIAHHFKESYVQYTKDKTEAGYQDFVHKTLLFLNRELAIALPTVSIYMTVGNNDSYTANYDTVVAGKFFHEQSRSWSQLIKDSLQQLAMKTEFPAAGFYSVDAGDDEQLRLIILNSTLFSAGATGDQIAEAAKAQLRYLAIELRLAKLMNKKVLILMHIPPGIDVYKTIHSEPTEIKKAWDKHYTEMFQEVIKPYSAIIAGVLSGHLHQDWFRIISSGHHDIPMIAVPSISPIHGNNPTYKIFEYADTTGLVNYQTYINNLTKQAGWALEYDFDSTYPAPIETSLIEHINAIQPTSLFDRYMGYYFTEGKTTIPSSEHKYYWCAIHHLDVESYQTCMSG